MTSYFRGPPLPTNTYISFVIHPAYLGVFAGRNTSSFVSHNRFLFVGKNIFICLTLHIQRKIVPSTQRIAFSNKHPTLRETHPRWSRRQGRNSSIFFFFHTFLFYLFGTHFALVYILPSQGIPVGGKRGVSPIRGFASTWIFALSTSDPSS